MKLTAVLLLVACLQVGAAGYSQKITLSERNAPLEKLFQEIRKQTSFSFLYNTRTLQAAAPVSIQVLDASLEEVLAQCFQYQPLSYTIKGKVVVVQRKEEQKVDPLPPPIEVRGKVTDSDGKPIEGVSVMIRGAGRGTQTDAQGSFLIVVPNEKAVLEISAIGYAASTLTVGSQTYLTITLAQEDRAMNNIVVVGYGTKKKENLTGAIDQIDSRDISSRPVSSLTTSLQGLMPGLNIQSNNGDPGATPDINIRGFNSLNGGGPLVLIDGIEGDLNRINPADVETVTVLKDAASAAIYGARGTFGVILVTTKKGKEGEAVINYTNSFGATTPTTRTDYISDPYEYGKIIDAAIWGYNGTSYTGYDEADWEIISKVAAGEIAPYQEKMANGNYKFFGNTDWYSYLFRKWQPLQNHNISLSGGSKRVQGYLSGRYFKTQSIQNIVDAPLIRYNLKANVNFQATDWLELGNNIQFSTNDQTEYGGYRTGFGGIWSNTTWYNLFAFHPKEIDGVPFDWAGGGAHGALEDKSNWIRNYSEQLINTFSAKATPVKDLVINFDYSNRITHIANTTRLNRFEQYTGDKVLMQTTGINRLTESRNRNYYNAMNIYGTYEKNLKDHNFKLLLGHNRENYESDNVLAEQGGLLYNDLANLNLGTELLRADGSASLWAVQGYFGRFNYSFKNRYLLEVNGRYDGSSRFPRDSRWGLFPSISGGWYLSREKFWKPLSGLINTFKLRASYGKLGNQNVDLYTFSQILGLGQSTWLDNGTRINYAGLPAPLPGTVSWETTKTVDIGADFSILRNKLNFSFDWYEKNTSDMYLPGEPLPGVFGAAEPKENIASLRNRGFELSVGFNQRLHVSGSPLQLRATASVSNFVGYITKYPNPNGVMSTFWEGQRLGQIWGFHVDGQFQSNEEAEAYQKSFANPSQSLGKVYKYIINTVQNSEWKGLKAGDIKYVDTNKDGKIDKGDYTLANHGDLVPIGNAMPQFPFGFTLRADWKGLDLSVAGTGVGRQDWYPTGDIYWGPYERPYLSFIRKDLVENAWTPEQPGNTYPQIYRGYASLGAERSLGEVNDYYLTNVGYLRIKNLTLGYTMPHALIQRFKMKNLRVYFSGENLLTWRFGNLTRYIDPEQAGSGINFNDPGSAVSRARMEDYPLGKTFSAGISVTL